MGNNGGAGGRPRKPTTLKILDGTFRKDRDGDRADEPRFSPGTSENPFDELRERDAHTEWNRIAPEFSRTALLHVASYQTLVRICRIYAEVLQYEKEIIDNGVMILQPVFSKATGEQTGEIRIQNPVTIPLRDARVLYNRLLNEFGGNPASASKVAAQKKPEKSTGNSFVNRFLTPKSSVG